MKLEAIETNYEGFRFRSRLEARWACFWDHADIEFQYEPQGFKIPESVVHGWSQPITNYLPDFFLPDLNLWVEAKASWTPKEKAKTFNAAAHFSAQGSDLLVCPEVFRQPRGEGARVPWRLHLEGDVLLASPWPDGIEDFEPEPVASAVNPFVFPDGPDLLRGCRLDSTAPDWYRDAARAAQRARFEWGERGH